MARRFNHAPRKKGSMEDPTVAEYIRKQTQYALNQDALPREELERRHGQVWSTDELKKDFVVIGFGAPIVVVSRKSDGQEGSLMFQHQPRYYWGFKENRV